MSERAAIRTSKKECVECWSKRIKETEVGTDWDLAEKRCWRCGKETELQRCHLIPDSLGGKDEASNIVLLCDKQKEFLHIILVQINLEMRKPWQRRF